MSVLWKQDTYKEETQCNKKGEIYIMENKAEIEIGLDYDDMGIVFKSILPELSDSPSKRSKTELSMDGNNLKICICTEDVVMLRASLNTWLRLINTACDMVEIVTDNIKYKPENKIARGMGL